MRPFVQQCYPTLKCVSLLALLLGFFRAPLSGQTLLTEEFSYCSGRRNGHFNYYIGFQPSGQGVADYMGAGTLDLNTKGARGGTLVIRLLEEGHELRRKHKVIVRPGENSPALQLSPSFEDSFVYEKKGRSTAKFVYNLVKNGSGSIVVRYDIVDEEHPDLLCRKSFEIPFDVSGMPEEDKAACQKALTAFESRKAGAEAELQAVLREFPEAPCRNELQDRLTQIRLYKDALEAGADCKKTRAACLLYQKKYENAPAFFGEEIAELLAKCPDAPEKPKPNPVLAPAKSAAQTDWEAIQGSQEPKVFRGYIERYANNLSARDYVTKAKQRLTRLSPLEIKENRIGDFEREYELINAIRPRYKDMSLMYGLVVEDSSGLLEHNKIKITLDRPGEYALRFIDETGKDTTIRISSAFSGEMTVLPDTLGYFIKISGGRPPYSVLLEDLETGLSTAIRTGVRGDTVVLRTAELDARALKGRYRVQLKGTGGGLPIDLGAIHNLPKDTDLLVYLMGLFGVLAFAIGGYLLFVAVKKRRKKTVLGMGVLLLLLMATALSGQTAFTFKFAAEGQLFEGECRVKLVPDRQDPKTVYLNFYDLDFGSPQANEKYALQLNEKGLDQGNYTVESFKKRIRHRGTEEVTLTISKAEKPITIRVNPSRFIVKDENNTFEITSAGTCALSYTAPKKAPQEVSNAPDEGSKTIAETPVEERPGPQKSNERPQKQATEPPISSEELAFKKATEAADRSAALVGFLNKYPVADPKRKAAALRYILSEHDFKANENVYQYTFKYAIDPILLFDTTLLEIVSAVTKEDNVHTFSLRLKPTVNKAAVIVLDAAKIPEERDTLDLERDMKALEAILAQKDDETYTLQLVGGDPIFRLNYYDENGVKVFSNPIYESNQTLSLKVADLRKQWNNHHGALTLKVVQKKGNITKEAGTLQISKTTPIWLYLALGVLGLVGTAFLVSRMRQAANRKAMAKKIKERREERGESGPMEDIIPLPPTPEMNVASSTGGAFKITRSIEERGSKALSEVEFGQQLQNGAYHTLDMGQQWRDSALTQIHFSKKGIAAIDDFLHQQRTQQIEEREGSIPEIGGFLLGHYTYSNQTKRYKVLLEEFVPIVPEENTVFQLQFGTESLVRELGEAQEEFPNLSLVGWFHTHPGHGLFLSKPDLAIQNGFFRAPYQFAMETDTLTPNWETGFFTRTIGGEANNIEHLITGSRWFDWAAMNGKTQV